MAAGLGQAKLRKVISDLTWAARMFAESATPEVVDVVRLKMDFVEAIDLAKHEALKRVEPATGEVRD